MRGVILLSGIQGAGVKTYRSHRLVIFSLANVSPNGTITSVRDKYDGIWRVWVNRSANRCIASETLDIVKGLLLFLSSVEDYVLLGEVRDDCGPMRES